MLEHIMTNRGFVRIEFVDKYGSECSLQESSLAFISCVWLGVHKNSPHYNDDGTTSRMHLTQDMVKELLPLLEHFVETGYLPQEATTDD